MLQTNIRTSLFRSGAACARVAAFAGIANLGAFSVLGCGARSSLLENMMPDPGIKESADACQDIEMPEVGRDILIDIPIIIVKDASPDIAPEAAADAPGEADAAEEDVHEAAVELKCWEKDGGVWSKAGSAVRITNSDGFSDDPLLVWNGNGYGVSWDDNRDGNFDIYFARLDKSGNKIGNETKITDDLTGPHEARYPSLAWNGTGYGTSWDLNSSKVFFTQIDGDGSKKGNHTDMEGTFPGNAFWSRLIWSGSKYGLLRDTYDKPIDNKIISILEIDGTKTVADKKVASLTQPDNFVDSRLAWTGSEFGMIWGKVANETGIYFTRIDAEGNKIGSEIKVAPAINLFANYGMMDLVWNGSGYGVCWVDSGADKLYFTRLDPSGNNIGANIEVTSAFAPYWPSLTWNGSQYGIAWGQGKLYFAAIGADSQKIGDDIEISSSSELPGSAEKVSLAWTGSGYGASWSNYVIDGSNNSNFEIFFNRIDCQ